MYLSMFLFSVLFTESCGQKMINFHVLNYAFNCPLGLGLFSFGEVFVNSDAILRTKVCRVAVLYNSWMPYVVYVPLQQVKSYLTMKGFIYSKNKSYTLIQSNNILKRLNFINSFVESCDVTLMIKFIKFQKNQILIYIIVAEEWLDHDKSKVKMWVNDNFACKFSNDGSRGKPQFLLHLSFNKLLHDDSTIFPFFMYLIRAFLAVNCCSLL